MTYRCGELDARLDPVDLQRLKVLAVRQTVVHDHVDVRVPTSIDDDDEEEEKKKKEGKKEDV